MAWQQDLHTVHDQAETKITRHSPSLVMIRMEKSMELMENQEDRRTSRAKLAGHRYLYLKLSQEFRILHLVYHRNKNQHRVAQWWKEMNMLKRNCAQVVELLQRENLAEKHLIKLYKLLNYFIRRQSPGTYYNFNGVIALGQFVTLGVILIGLLGRIYAIYKETMCLFEPKFRELNFFPRSNLRKLREEVVDSPKEYLGFVVQEEVGEEIIPAWSEPHEQDTAPSNSLLQAENETTTINSKRSKSRKKKKAKSAIDSIFG